MPAQRIIAAVSGGVDSIVMLHHLVSKQRARSNIKKNATFHLQPSTFQIIVAHVDHGMRDDSAADARFVQTLASTYDLPFELGNLNLGFEASEEAAREERHGFLESVRNKYPASVLA